MVRLEERLLSKEAALDQQRASLATREEAVEQHQAEIGEIRERHVRELERVAGLSASQAKQILLRELEDQIRHECARTRAPDRGGDQARRRPPRPQHPLAS